jgi:hypothetical protein
MVSPTTTRQLTQACTQEKHEFVSRIFRASGISMTRSAVPTCLQPTLVDEPKNDMTHAAKEARLVYGQVVEEVLRKTGACGAGPVWQGVRSHAVQCVRGHPLAVRMLQRE